jgi:hypothetical protein
MGSIMADGCQAPSQPSKIRFGDRGFDLRPVATHEVRYFGDRQQFSNEKVWNGAIPGKRSLRT